MPKLLSALWSLPLITVQNCLSTIEVLFKSHVGTATIVQQPVRAAESTSLVQKTHLSYRRDND